MKANVDLRDAVNVTSDDRVVPYRCVHFNMSLSDYGRIRSNPAVLNSWIEIVKGYLDSVLCFLFGHGELRLKGSLFRERLRRLARK